MLKKHKIRQNLYKNINKKSRKKNTNLLKKKCVVKMNLKNICEK